MGVACPRGYTSVPRAQPPLGAGWSRSRHRCPRLRFQLVETTRERQRVEFALLVLPE